MEYQTCAFGFTMSPVRHESAKRYFFANFSTLYSRNSLKLGKSLLYELTFVII